MKKALKKTRVNERLHKITTDKHPYYGPTIENLKKGKHLKPAVKHRQIRYLNNIIASDHRRIERRKKPMMDLKSLVSVY